MSKREVKQAWILLLCAAMMCAFSGCGNKEDAPSTAAERKAFEGHKPTPEEFQKAMAGMQKSAATAPNAAEPK